MNYYAVNILYAVVCCIYAVCSFDFVVTMVTCIFSHNSIYCFRYIYQMSMENMKKPGMNLTKSAMKHCVLLLILFRLVLNMLFIAGQEKQVSG